MEEALGDPRHDDQRDDTGDGPHGEDGRPASWVEVPPRFEEVGKEREVREGEHASDDERQHELLDVRAKR